jgi:PAS domain S-box-containing protein
VITDLTVLLIIITTAELGLILVLLRNRRRYKVARRLLQQSHSELELRVKERTQRLDDLNQQLYDEISKRKTTAELLRESREYINSIINSLPSILIGVTPQGTVTHWNSGAEHSTNMEARDALGQSVISVFPDLPISVDIIQEAINHNTAKVYESIQQMHDDELYYLDVSVFPLVSNKLSGAVIRIEDVTMRVKLENMMIQNEKMMSLGELAAGTAHEINNPLGVILQGVQNIKRRLSSTLDKNTACAQSLGLSLNDINRYLEARRIDVFIDGIEEAGQRANQIVSNMLEFSRSNNRTFQAINLIDLVEHTLQLIRSTTQDEDGLSFADIDLCKDFQDKLPTVMCSGVEIQQVVMNLIKNAFQAIAQQSDRSKPPKITIRVHSDNHYITLAVQDNGPGIPPSVQRHIFEPFFTTKDVGKGTGLGLSVSYFIITEHHEGTIEVESSPEDGSCFSIQLPLFTPQRH